MLSMEKVPPEIFAIFFSPYTAHAIDVDGVMYATVEHAYQCARYTDEKVRAEIRSQKSPVKAWETSAKYKSTQIPEFADENFKIKVMKGLMTAKVMQHEDVRKALLDSGDEQIVKHISTYPPGDGFWDDGKNGEGLNQMGRIWMEIRDELKKRL